MLKRLVFGVVLVCGLLTGCTSQVWQQPSYEEWLTGFYGVENEDFVIVTGQRYSYVLDADSRFQQVLQLSRDVEFRPAYQNFYVDEDNQVTGTFKLMTTSPDNSEGLAELGFTRLSERSQLMQTEFNLTGRRFEVEGDYPFEMLESPHFVRVYVPVSGTRQIGRIIATPFAVTIDAIAVIPIGAIFALAALAN